MCAFFFFFKQIIALLHICYSAALSFTPQTRHKPTHPFGELSVHHEVVNMLLSLGQLQLPGYYGNHQSRAARALREREREEGGREEEKQSQSVQKYWYFLDEELAPVIDENKEKYEDGSWMTGEVEVGEEGIRRDSSVPDPHFFMLRGKPSLFSLPIHLVWDAFYIASICNGKIYPYSFFFFFFLNQRLTPPTFI